MSDRASSVFWSAEWEKLNLGAKKAPAGAVLNKLLFVECGFGVDRQRPRRPLCARAETQSSSIASRVLLTSSLAGELTCLFE
jgi:hypothetical protein